MNISGLEHLGNLVVDFLGKVGNCEHSTLLGALLAHTHCTVCLFLLTYNHHIRDALHLVVAHLTTDLLVAVVDSGANTLLVEFLCHLLCIVIIFLRDRQNGYLVGSEPQGEMSCSVLDKHSAETLERTERGAVDHHGHLLGVVLVGVFELETLGQVLVNLDGTQLPATTDGVLHHKVELRSVEGSLAIFYLGIQSLLATSLDDGVFALLPHLV